MMRLVLILLLFDGVLMCHAGTGPPVKDTLAVIVSNFCQRFRPDLTTNGLSLNQRTKPAVRTGNNVQELETSFGAARKAIFSVDEKTGEVVHFSAFVGFSAKQLASSNRLTMVDLMSNAEQFARAAAPSNALLRLAHTNRVKLSAQSARAVADYVWQRSDGGFVWKHDYVRVMLDGEDGELLALRKEWGNGPAVTNAVIGRTAAESKATEVLRARIKPNAPLRVRTASLCVVGPNADFGAAQAAVGTRRLAWAIELSTVDAKDKQWELWVDAATGEVIGGETLL